MPVNEISQQLEAGGLTLFRVELDGEYVIPCHRSGKGQAVGASAAGRVFLRILDEIAVDEIEAGGVGYPGPERVRHFLDNFIPAHVRYLQSISRTILQSGRETPYVARKDSQTLYAAFLAALKQHLQADANPQKWLGAGCFDYRFG